MFFHFDCNDNYDSRFPMLIHRKRKSRPNSVIDPQEWKRTKENFSAWYDFHSRTFSWLWEENNADNFASIVRIGHISDELKKERKSRRRTHTRGKWPSTTAWSPLNTHERIHLALEMDDDELRVVRHVPPLILSLYWTGARRTPASRATRTHHDTDADIFSLLFDSLLPSVRLPPFASLSRLRSARVCVRWQPY